MSEFPVHLLQKSQKKKKRKKNGTEKVSKTRRGVPVTSPHPRARQH